jgi:hypothetical protein
MIRPPTATPAEPTDAFRVQEAIEKLVLALTGSPR